MEHINVELLHYMQILTANVSSVGIEARWMEIKKENIMNSNKTQRKNPSNISVIPIYRGSVLNIFSIKRFKNVGESVMFV